MNIALVATGGSIGSRIVKGTTEISDAATAQIASIIGASSVFDKFKIHSEGIEFADLNTLRLTIEDALATNPDGVIVAHGTDTLAFSAAYLAFVFCDARVPIVMCSADKPLTDPDSNGHAILAAAKSFLANAKPGVYAVYRNAGSAVKVHHGARLLAAHIHEHFYFSIGDSAFKGTGLMRGMEFDLTGARKVLCIHPYVGLDYDAFDTDGYAAIVHMAYHSGRVNVAELNRFAAKHPDITVYLTAGRKKYDKTDLQPNIVQCHGIAPTALYIKLLIGLRNNVKDLTAFVMKNACGEFVKN